MPRSVIHLLGDAILDNYYWLSDKNNDLKKEISSLGHHVNNYAIDDASVTSIINGIKPKEIYVKSRPYPYPIDNDGKIRPLTLLSRNINRSFSSTYGEIKPINFSNDSNDDHMIVLSMGGNDLGTNIIKILLGIDKFINSVITKDFIANYENIISSAKKQCNKIVLVSIYLPYLGPGSVYNLYSSYSKPVMDKWHDFVYAMAKKYNIPVLDLSRTFDYNDRSHYGSDITRSSNKSSKCIAQCLSHIYHNYSGHKIYYAPKCDATNIKHD